MILKRKRNGIPIVVLFSVLHAVLFAGCGGPPGEVPAAGGKRKPPLVKTVKARTGDLTRTLETTGEVTPTKSVVIASTKEGPIAACAWREGDTVQGGNPLVEIDRETNRAEAQAARAALTLARAKLADLKAGARPEETEQAKARVAKWQATLTETRSAYERQKELIEQDFTSRQSLDQARERLEVAQAELNSAQQALRALETGPTKTEIAVAEAAVEEAAARLALAEAHLAECVVTAPFDGIVTRVHVRPGDLAVPRSPLIEMYDPNSLVVRFSVPEAFAGAVRTGQRVEVVLDALGGTTRTGRLSRVYPLLDPELRTRTVEAEPTSSQGLIPNQFARVTLFLDQVTNAVIVPAEAIMETPEGSKIAYVVEAGKAMRRKVRTGIEQATQIQLVEGIEAGEQVVTAGNAQLKPGAPVRVAGMGGETGGGRKKPDGGSSSKATGVRE